MLVQALASLTPRERAAVVLTDVLGYSSEEAGRWLHIKPVTVRTGVPSLVSIVKVTDPLFTSTDRSPGANDASSPGWAFGAGRTAFTVAVSITLS